MADNHHRTPHSEPESYEIKVQGHLDGHWTEWFDGLVVSYDEIGDTVLCGPVPDQAALHGLLGRVRDLGLVLISVQRRGSDRGE